ncbi:Uncharacterized protein PECH_000275 [Penicillium ucsense]|uniref:Terpene synthase n=1 Tax=Penicillium ucsense TaxID=2839758 RepID=A0A8J8W6G5_9EURO|nr:Uncharacterized protein PECM_008602 [Penicillium ucsense]KAF7738552.1 Uncharacterized protein PECH_000275 [Penicillium ucsense]
MYPDQKSEKVVEKLRQSDFALLACLWWPHVDLNTLRLLSCLALWYLLWDDELESRYPDVEGNGNAAETFRMYTRAAISMSIGISEENRKTLEDAPHLVQLFCPLGSGIKSRISEDNRVLLLQMIDKILEDSKKEQHFVVTERLPSIEQFWEFRTGTNLMEALYPITSLTTEIELLPNEMRHPLLRAYWEQINKIIAITNDILSFKKEIEKKETLNLVFLIYFELGNLQDAIDSTVKILVEAVDESRRLKAKVLALTEEHIHRFIEAWDFYAIGFLHWSLVTARYGLNPFLQEDGTFIVSLSECFS